MPASSRMRRSRISRSIPCQARKPSRSSPASPRRRRSSSPRRRPSRNRELVMKSSLSCAAAAAAVALAGLSVGALAQEVAPYAGKQIRMVIASGAGGGYDTYARVLTQRLAAHIPGNPSVVNENMPGAAGLNATNWTATQAPKDGTVLLATYNALLLEPLFGNKKAAFDPDKLEWIGSIGKQQQICMTWHAS